MFPFTRVPFWVPIVDPQPSWRVFHRAGSNVCCVLKVSIVLICIVVFGSSEGALFGFGQDSPLVGGTHLGILKGNHRASHPLKWGGGFPVSLWFPI